MSFNLATSGAIIRKAGDGVSSISTSGAALSEWCDQAEGFVMSETRQDWVADLSSIDANKRGILSEAVSSLAAINLINYDMSGYTSRLEAQTMLDVLRDSATRAINTLKEDKSKTFLGVS